MGHRIGINTHLPPSAARQSCTKMGTQEARGHRAVWMLFIWVLWRTTTLATCIMYQTQELTMSLNQQNSSHNTAKYHWWHCRCGAPLSAAKSNAVNLILRLLLYHFFTYNELVMSWVHPQQHKQPTNTTTMVMEPLTPPAAWLQWIHTIRCLFRGRCWRVLVESIN